MKINTLSDEKSSNPDLFSIKRRLTLTTITVASALVLLSWILTFYETRHEIDEVYDARLGQSAKILALSMPHMLQEPADIRTKAYSDWYHDIQLNASDDDTVTTFGHPYEQNLMFQFFTQNEVILKSPGAPTTLIGDVNQPGFSFVTINNEEWRRFQIQLPPQPNIDQAAFLVTAERHAIRSELINEIAISTGLPQLILIPILALTIIFLVNKFLQPIDDLRKAIAQRNINKLDSIRVPQPTVELAPLVNQLNYLFAELDKAWQRERRLTRTAAHELKTPLAVLRLNAENALNSSNKHELKNDLTNILHGIDRTDRLIQQLLMLSKVEAEQTFSPDRIEVMACLRDVIASLAPIALKQKQELSLEGPDSIMTQGNAMLLCILFSNIIDNAIRYSGTHSSIEITVTDQNSSEILAADIIEITVNDNGTTIQNDIRDKIFEKFFRGNTERGDGAGLGMSIVADIATMHGGNVKLLPSTDHQGNAFLISLPCDQS